MPYLPRVRRLMAEGSASAFADASAPTAALRALARLAAQPGSTPTTTARSPSAARDGGYAAFSDQDTIATALQDAGYATLLHRASTSTATARTAREHDVPTWLDRLAGDGRPVDVQVLQAAAERQRHGCERSPAYTTDVMTAHAQEMITRPSVATGRGSPGSTT